MKLLPAVIIMCLSLTLCGAALDSGKRVIYVPGWLRSGADHNDNFTSLARIFPDSALEVHRWDSDRISFAVCRDNADREGTLLAEKLIQLSPEERGKVVLVGHSLGARVVIRAMARLAERKMQIARGVVLAAALPWDDADLRSAAKASAATMICVCCQRDFTLKYLYGAGGENGNQALGINGWGADTDNVTTLFMPPFIPEQVIPDAAAMNFAAMRRLCVHLAKFYLEFLADYRDHHNSEIVVRQDRLNHPAKVIDAEIWWEVIDFSDGWKLEQHIVTGHCRILDPESVRRAWGNYRAMCDSFENIKRQQGAKP